MAIQEHETTVGGRRVRVIERDLGGAESVFYVGQGGARVELRYDERLGVSRYECDEGTTSQGTTVRGQPLYA